MNDTVLVAVIVALSTAIPSVLGTWAVVHDNDRKRRADTRQYVDKREEQREQRWREWQDDQFEQMRRHITERDDRIADLEQRDRARQQIMDRMRIEHRTLIEEQEAEQRRMDEKIRQIAELHARVAGLEAERDTLRAEIVARDKEITDLRWQIQLLSEKVEDFANGSNGGGGA